MKKNTKLLIGAGFAVILLGAALTTVLLLPSEKDKISENDNQAVVLYDKQDCLAESISITNASGSFELLAYERQVNPSVMTSGGDVEEEPSINVIYTMQDHAELDLDKDMTDYLTTQCQKFEAARVISRDEGKYAEYGLDNPKVTAEIVYDDNSLVKLYLGNDSPDQKGVYLRRDGDPKVYLAEKGSVDSFYFEKLQLFDKELTTPVHQIKSVQVSGTAYPEELSITLNTVTEYLGKYKMTSPTANICDNQKFKTITDAALNYSAERVQAIDVSEEQLSDYGLDQPYETFTIQGDKGEFIRLIAGKPDDDGKIYLMIPERSIVYQSTAEATVWYGVTREEFLTDGILKPNPDAVKIMKIDSGERHDTYEVTREKKYSERYDETIVVNITHQGNAVTFTNFSNFIQGISGLERTGKKPADLKGFSEIFRAEFQYDDVKTVDHLVLYRNSDGKTAAVLNDYIESYVDETYTARLLEQIPLIDSETVIPPLNEPTDVV